MKRLLTVFLFLMLLTGLALADDGYVVTNYDFVGTLRVNNVMEVTEIITANFRERSHGIIRSLPEMMTVNVTAMGGEGENQYHLSIEDIDVDAPYSVSHSDNYTDIRIGDENVLVTGEKTYRISYRVVIPDDRLKDADFIFYSVLGAEMTTNVEHLSFRVDFEKPLPPEAVENFRIYSGRYGSIQNSKDVQFTVDEQHVEGTGDGFRSREAVTLFAIIPGTYFEGAKKANSIPAYIAWIATLLIGIKGLLMASKTHREKLIETVEFYPPDDITSAEAGKILNGSVNDRIMLSMIPYWAGKGYLTIEERREMDERHKDLDITFMILHKEKDLDWSANEYEKILFSGLFGKEDEVYSNRDLGGEFVQSIDNAKRSLNSLFNGDRALTIGVGQAVQLLLITLLAFGLLITLSSAVTLFHNGIFALYACFFLLIIGGLSIYRGVHGLSTGIFAVVTAILLVLAFGIMLSCVGEDCAMPAFLMWAAFLLASCVCILCGRMIQPTEYKKSIYGRVAGFRNFIETAERDRIDMMVSENPEYYYDILPYAMAFGLTTVWAHHFAHLRMEPPYWYYGYYGTWDYRSLDKIYDQSIIHTVSRARASQASSSSSSSGGGGGFSGGGAGGGGTSRW